MIDINYTLNEIKITTHNLKEIFSESQLPLNIFFIRPVK